MSVIRVSNISKSYNEIEVLKNINLDINEGEHIGIVGPNGSGKSTLIKIIMGIEEADIGRIEVPNKDTIGYLKQATEYNTTEFLNLLVL